VLILPTDQAEPGMRLAMPVTHPENPQQELLRRGFTLTEGMIARLRELDIRGLYIDYPGLEDLDKHLAPALSPERQVLYVRLKDSIATFQRSTSPSVDYWDYHATTRDFLSALLSADANPIYLDKLSQTLGGHAVEHGIAVAHLALVLGVKLQAYLVRQRKHLRTTHAKDIVNVGIAAMLHDIGKTRLPERLRSAHVLTPPQHAADRADYEAHPVRGYEMLRNDVKPTAAAAVLHHHQHFDGTGFPTATAREGQDIHVYARILLAADLYERLALAPDGKTRRPNLEILHLMRQRYARWIDPEVLATMPKVVPPFPPGSKVTLSDGRTCIVTGVDAEHPYRPIVCPLAADGRSLSDKSIRLRKCPELSVRQAEGVIVGDMAPPTPQAA
jgi:HD-GYP domain-containing protein (c-di-GMP phosphodiesterase class II)